MKYRFLKNIKGSTDGSTETEYAAGSVHELPENLVKAFLGHNAIIAYEEEAEQVVVSQKKKGK